MTEGIAAAGAAVMASARPSDMSGPHRRRARSLLAGTAFAGGVFAALMASAQNASAACTVTVGGSVACATNTTTSDTVNTDAIRTNSTDRIQFFSKGANIVGSVGAAGAGVTISGAGLEVAQGIATATLDMTNNGIVSIDASTAERGALLLSGTGGAITYNGSGSAISNVAAQDHDGLTISNSGSGAVTVGGNAAITGTFTGSGTGSGIAITTGAGDQNVTIGAAAIKGASGLSMSSGNGNQLLSIDGATVTATGASGSAISLTATGSGSISATVANTTFVNASGAVHNTAGINVNTGNGDATVTSSASIGGDPAATLFQTGINAISNGTGNVTVTSNGAVNAAVVGIQAFGGGNVTVAGSGAVTSGTTSGNLGIEAESQGGNVLVAQTNTVKGGILATTGGTGTVTVQATNSVTDAGFAGIQVGSFDGNTTVNVTNAGTVIAGAGAGIDSNMIGAGSLAINVAQGTKVTGASGGGIRIAHQNGLGAGTYAVDNSGTITGLGSANQAVINVTTTTGSTTITNRAGGTIQSVAGLADDVVVASTGGPIAIVNAGALTGRVTLAGAGAKSIVNNAGGIWSTLGSSDFTGGSSTIDNSGTIVIAGAATFNNLTTLTNKGAINLTSASGTLNQSGNLVFTPGSSLSVQVSPASASQVVVGGTATLAGSVQASFSPGSYVSRNYTILSAGSRSGKFDSLTTNLLPAGFTAALDYSTPNAVVLDLTATLGLTPGSGLQASALNRNQRNVANALNNAFNTGSVLPPGFLPVFGLTGGNLGTALTQLSGEVGAGFSHGALQAGNSFLNLMLNPFVENRGNGSVGGVGPIGYAPGRTAPTAAFAAITDAPAGQNFDQRFGLWGGAYGGTGSVDGDAGIGSHNTSSRAFGVAAGADYRLTPATVVGFALAGGGTNWNLDQSLGSGRSDLFQAGVYGTSHFGPAYLSAAFGYSLHDVTTNRTVTLAGTDQLQANFRANVLSARLEGGYRYASAWLAVTPYAAAQLQSLLLPGYREGATAGSGQFALSYAAQNTTATRGELGAWFDRSWRGAGGAQVTLFGRAAWAHDFNNVQTATALFQTLPGSSFTVDGAKPAPDSALVTAGAQYRLMSGWSLQAKFDGEFSGTTASYSGTGVVRKEW